MRRSTPAAAPCSTALKRVLRQKGAVDDGEERHREQLPGRAARFAISSVAATSSAGGTGPNVSRVQLDSPNVVGQAIGGARCFLGGVHVHAAALHHGAPKETAAAGTPIRAATLKAPADSPKMVTRSGSPPNCAMWSRTQRKRRHLIMQAPVPDEAVRIAQAGMPEKSERAQAVVDRDDDDVASRASWPPR